MSDSFDEMIGAAMRGRAEHVPLMDVAGEALARVRAQEQRIARLARISFWKRVSSVAAAVLIVVTVGVGYLLWPASTASSTTDVADTTTTLSSASSIDMTTVGIAAFVVTLVAVVLLTVMMPERPALRLTPA